MSEFAGNLMRCILATMLSFAFTHLAVAATVIRNVRVFDGNRVIESANVVIEADQIVSVSEDTDLSGFPDQASVVDGSGKTLLPGLIDAHVHVWGRDQLERALDFGVTTMLDMGSSRELALQSRKEESAGEATDRADLRSAVLWVTAPGSHGTQFGEVPTLSEPGQAASFVAERVKGGADYIKVIYDHFKMFPRDIPTLSRETMTATVAAAKEHDRMAVFHSRDIEAMTHAVAAGASGFVHVAVDEVPGDELIRAMSSKGVFVTPNLSLARHDGLRLVDDPEFGPMLTESEVENLRKWRSIRNEDGDEVEYQALMDFHRGGVTVLAGTDIPNGGTTVGASMHLELELLVEAGMTPLEALRAATSSPARAYKLTDRGRIAPGMLADMILVEGNPAERIKDTRKTTSIWKSGVLQE